MSLGYRSNDAVVTICQNNQAKSIEIHHVNPAAVELLGYDAVELEGKKLDRILPPRIAEMLNEFVEFEENANDVGEVLAKVQSFSIVGRDDKETGFRLKVVRTEPVGGSLSFALVLQDKNGMRRNENIRSAIAESFKGHEALDPDIALPDRYSLGKDIDLITPYNNKAEVRSCFAILQLDHADELFGQYGRTKFNAIRKHVAMLCRNNLRPDDVVGIISNRRTGVLLMDTVPEGERIVFNRLRWQIAASPFVLPDNTTVGLSVSISFCAVGGENVHKNLIEICEHALDRAGPSATNALVEI
ncbi:MAG: PAS domain-containing protein [Alphaproteobacteria bacterium]|nr:PAS domain-containing protein [Alphaproteobacteria bacterium]